MAFRKPLREHKNIAASKYYHSNKEVVLEKQKEYYEKNKTEILAKNKKYNSKLSDEAKLKIAIRNKITYNKRRIEKIKIKIDALQQQLDMLKNETTNRD